MPALSQAAEIQLIRESAHPLTGEKHDCDPLFHLIGEARFVLLGEATHGTHEFYKTRAEITKRLIVEKQFNVIAWEADWPSAWRVNRFIRGFGDDQSALESLSDFQRFPTWMWRNADIVDLIGWLRTYNERLPARSPKVGVYGMDLYSLFASLNAVVDYLEKRDPKLAQAARDRYSCFEHFTDDPQAYGATAALDWMLSCEDEVVVQLADLHRRRNQLTLRGDRTEADEYFFAEQNARLAKNAEHYYRALFRGRTNTWNLRDQHMVETIDELFAHLEQQGEKPKAIIWAHNSHLGDARATQMSNQGELNVGQLMRERHPDETVNIGFTTYSGTVTAASEWGEPAERKIIRPALTDSYEEMFHETEMNKFLLVPSEKPELKEALSEPLLERAIGVIYSPETERMSHYFHCRIAEQFDAILHFDETRALEPIERTALWEKGEIPETYPSGF